MSMETDLTTLLHTKCARVAPDVAKEGTARPYVTWQELGGRGTRNLDGTASDKRHTFLQITVWDETREGALALIRSIEDAMCASASFTASPQGEPLSLFEDGEPNLYGSVQRFGIYSLR